MNVTAYHNSYSKGLTWLLSQQTDEGAWCSPLPLRQAAPSTAITSLAISVLSGELCRDHYVRERENAIAWLLTKQLEDGSFGEGPAGSLYTPYATAFATSALCAADQNKYETQIRSAAEFLKNSQVSNGIHRGGVGLGMKESFPDGRIYTRPFSHPATTTYVAEALRDASCPLDDEFWPSMVDFYRGLHNSERLNVCNAEKLSLLQKHGLAFSNDGGMFFIRFSGEDWDKRTPATGAAPELLVSTGGTTLQGIIAYLSAGLAPDAPEVKAAMDWLRRNFSVEEHPGYARAVKLDQRRLAPNSPKDALENASFSGLYQYYRTLAKALQLYGESPLRVSDTLSHDWSIAIAEQLVKKQQSKRFWTNENSRWLETEAPLSTAFALLTWTLILKYLDYRRDPANHLSP